MEIANVRVKLEKVGSDVEVKDATPAEVMFLHILHSPRNGGESFGRNNDQVNINGTAMIDTGQRKKIVTKAAVPEQIQKGKLVSEAQPQQIVPGALIAPAVPEHKVPGVPAKGTPGKPDYVTPILETLVKAQPEQRGPGYLIQAVPAVYGPDMVIPMQPEEFKMEPILRPRTDAEELARLVRKYNQARDKQNKPIINSVWPDRLNPNLPQKFSDINWTQVNEMFGGLQPEALNYATGSIARTTL